MSVLDTVAHLAAGGQVGDDKRLVYEEGPWTGTMQAPVIASVHDIALAWPKNIQ